VTGVIKSGTNHLSGTVRASATEFSAGEEVSFVRAAANTTGRRRATPTWR